MNKRKLLRKSVFKKILLIGLVIFTLIITIFIYLNYSELKYLWELNQALGAKNWQEYKDNNTKIAFSYPSQLGWFVSGKGWTSAGVKCKNPHWVALEKTSSFGLLICKNPDKGALTFLLRDNRYTSSNITLGNNTYTLIQTNLEKSLGLKTQRYLVSQNQDLLIEPVLPPLGDNLTTVVKKEDQIFQRIVSSIKNID